MGNGNFCIAWDNQVDTATLSLGSWNAGSYGLNNLKDYRLSKKARTTNAAEASTKLRFALADKINIGAVILAGTNCSVEASSQLLIYSDSGFTSLVYDSGVVAAYPDGTIPYGQIPFGAPNWWTGKPLPAEIARFQRNICHVLSNHAYEAYGELRIFDSGNAAGYIEAGRLFVGQAWQPEVNAEYGSVQLRLTPRTRITRARDGTPYWDAERPDFSIPFSLHSLDKDEAMRSLDIQALVDLHGEVWVSWDPDDVEYAFRRQAFGRLAALDPVEHPRWALYKTGFQVEGVL